MFICSKPGTLVRPDLSMALLEVMAIPVIGLVLLVGIASLVTLFAGAVRARRARLVLQELLNAMLEVLKIVSRALGSEDRL